MNSLSRKRYIINKSIGEGGMAEVFLAYDTILKKQVAIKVLKDEFIGNKNICKRFIEEAKKLNRIDHQNIVRASDYIDELNYKAFVMDYIEGKTLRWKIDKNEISEKEIITWTFEMLDALQHCHNKGWIHRDIKPSNFMVKESDGKIKLLDFGIVKDLNLLVEFTETHINQNLGTLVYMSPEQIKNPKNIDHRTDIYSFGVVLWEMINRSKPYDTKNLSSFEIQLKIVNETLPILNSPFDDCIQKCTQKDPNNRYQNCLEIKEVLRNIKTKNKDDVDKQTKNQNDDGEQTKIEVREKIPIKPDNDFSIPYVVIISTLILTLIFFLGMYYFIEYQPTHKDTDHDGWADVEDNCPSVYSKNNNPCPKTEVRFSYSNNGSFNPSQKLNLKIYKYIENYKESILIVNTEIVPAYISESIQLEIGSYYYRIDNGPKENFNIENNKALIIEYPK
jgi:serine/threonine protein kinase